MRVEEGEVNFKYGMRNGFQKVTSAMYYYHKRLAPYQKWTNGEAGSSKQQATARRQSTDGGKETERTRVGARRTVSSPTYSLTNNLPIVPEGTRKEREGR